MYLIDHITILIVDNKETCNILINHISINNQLKICDIAHDGEEALDKIIKLNPDIILLDLILPKIDGLSVLEKLKNLKLKKQPIILITSSVYNHKIISQAINLGAAYYMIKPYKINELVKTILLFKPKDKNKSNESSDFRELLMHLGAPTNWIGYKYIIESIEFLTSNENSKYILKDLYSLLADKYQTSPECVEIAIRKTIHKIFKVNNEILDSLAKNACIEKSNLLSNSKFLTTLAEIINNKKLIKIYPKKLISDSSINKPV